MHYSNKSVLTSSKCTILNHAVQGKCGLIVLFLAKVTFQPSWCVEIYTINGSHASTFKHIKFVWWLNCSDSFRLVSLVSNFETAKASQNKSPNKSTWIKAIKLCNIHYFNEHLCVQYAIHSSMVENHVTRIKYY